MIASDLMAENVPKKSTPKKATPKKATPKKVTWSVWQAVKALSPRNTQPMKDGAVIDIKMPTPVREAIKESAGKPRVQGTGFRVLEGRLL